MSSKSVWLIGCGAMAIDYAKVLSALGTSFLVIGRGTESAKTFTQQSGGVHPISGGLNAFLAESPALPVAAIIAVGVESLASVTQQLLDFGVSRILVEKPGAITRQGLFDITVKAKSRDAKVFVAYNRRFYAATLHALRLIQEDGGMQSMNFEFTEWSDTIRGLQIEQEIKHSWFLANSTHVVDLAFYFGGVPAEIQCFTRGALDWHPNSSIFAGAGRTNQDVLFSYQANWGAPGRWGLEILTRNHRLIFRPMEALQVMSKGSVSINMVDIDDRLDKEYKPGLYEQVSRFLSGRFDGFCDIDEQLAKWNIYCQIAGYPCS